MKSALINTLILLLLSCCHKLELISPQYNAEIISYESRKTYCLYGWMIKIGNDTILTDSWKVGNLIGYEAKLPIKAKVEIANPAGCSCKYKYYDVTAISIRENNEILFDSR